MPKYNNPSTPVGVVPRRQLRAIDSLMSDGPEPCTVAEDVEPAAGAAAPAWSHWLPSVTVVTALAGAIEWLKLTR